MNSKAPMLVVQASPKAESASAFRAWLLGSHLAEARSIPAMSGVTAGVTRAGTWSIFYTFASAEAFERALGSPEAAYARGTWERWDDQLEDRSTEVWAPLIVSPIQVRRN
jgi:hypothetical protein